MKYIDEVAIINKRVLLRVDFNLPLDARHHIINDARIRQSLPTIEYLLKGHNRLLLLSHLGRPRGIEPQLSLEPIVKRLREYLPGVTIRFVKDLKSLPKEFLRNPLSNDIFFLENIRFFKEEEENNQSFAKELASLAEVFVNDAFSVSHRKTASIVGIPQFLPSYGGLLMKKEVETIQKVISHPHHPFIAILGGAKISTKMKLVEKLITLADIVLLGGGLANTFLLALGTSIGKSLAEPQEVPRAMYLLKQAEVKQTRLLLPQDAIVGDPEGMHVSCYPVQSLPPHARIFDIGPQTRALFTQAISQAKTIIWNGPMGLSEVPMYKKGTDAIYEAISGNREAISIVGGGETLAAIQHKHHLDRITHISSGGGAMLEFVEHGTLPGIEALNASSA